MNELVVKERGRYLIIIFLHVVNVKVNVNVNVVQKTTERNGGEVCGNITSSRAAASASAAAVLSPTPSPSSS